MARQKSILVSAIAVLALAAAPLAQAQSWLAPARSGETPLGPFKAKGAVIWSHGRSIASEDSEAPTPSYMEVLREHGWDTFRFNRMRVDDTLPKSTAGLVQIVHQLKAQGYRDVALTGQSFGAFLSLMAADASDEVDAVIATAPAAYGSFSDFYDSWRSNATKLYPLLADIRHARVMVFYFHGDDFDPGGRGDRSREIFDEHHIAHVVVDQPPQLTSHWAATTPLFTRRFAGCILGFLEAPQLPQAARCQNDQLWSGDVPPPAEVSSAAEPGQGAAQKHAKTP